MDLPHSGTEDADQAITCPMVCDTCQQPGDCEDCLDCLYWPKSPPDEPVRQPILRGRASPLQSTALARARADLQAGTRLGLLVRRFRAEHQLSQRALAQTVGVHHTTLCRAEADAGGLALDKVEQLLAHVGFRIAFVPLEVAVGTPAQEESDDIWGTTQLLARDARGRRLPPHGRPTWLPTDDVRLRFPHHPDKPRWTWQRPG